MSLRCLVLQTLCCDDIYGSQDLKYYYGISRPFNVVFTFIGRRTNKCHYNVSSYGRNMMVNLSAIPDKQLRLGLVEKDVGHCR